MGGQPPGYYSLCMLWVHLLGERVNIGLAGGVRQAGR